MDNTLLVSLSHQLAAYRSMDVIANNIANVSTPGFKRESVKFEEYISSMRPAEGETGPKSISFVQDTGVSRDLRPGTLLMTNAPFDVAVGGKGYFAVQTANGERYTRDGHFSLDTDGNLVDSNGNKVMGDGGPITLTPDDGTIHFAEDGTITGQTTTGTTNQLGKLRVVDFENDSTLQAEGNNLFSTDQPAQTATDGRVQQGMLENSNVEPVVEMAKMIDVMRAYEATANLSQAQEDLMKSAIDKLGGPVN
jgi:flagellar basal-body rod protein FlgF